LALRRLLRIGDFTGVITVGTNKEPGVPGADASSSSFHKTEGVEKAAKLKNSTAENMISH